MPSRRPRALDRSKGTGSLPARLRGSWDVLGQAGCCGMAALEHALVERSRSSTRLAGVPKEARPPGLREMFLSSSRPRPPLPGRA